MFLLRFDTFLMLVFKFCYAYGELEVEDNVPNHIHIEFGMLINGVVVIPKLTLNPKDIVATGTCMHDSLKRLTVALLCSSNALPQALQADCQSMGVFFDM